MGFIYPACKLWGYHEGCPAGNPHMAVPLHCACECHQETDSQATAQEVRQGEGCDSQAGRPSTDGQNVGDTEVSESGRGNGEA